MNTIQNFLASSVETGNKTRSRVTLAKIDVKDKSKDAPRSAKQSIAVYNPLNDFLKAVINNAHKEITGGRKHLLLLSELLLNLPNIERLNSLTETTTKAIKRLRFMFPTDETTNEEIVRLLVSALNHYRLFTQEESNRAILAKVEADADFTEKLQNVSMLRLAANKANADAIEAEAARLAAEAEAAEAARLAAEAEAAEAARLAAEAEAAEAAAEAEKTMTQAA